MSLTDNQSSMASGIAGSVGGGAASTAGMFASLVSAYIQCTDYPIPPITFHYNPEAFTDVTEGKWKDSPQPASNGGVPQWLGVIPPKISVKIVLDAFSLPKPFMMPSETIDTLKMLVLPTADSLATGMAAAPTVMFGWGANVIMPEAIVTKVAVTYERFLLGIPVRATAVVDLKAIPMPEPLGPTNPTSGGLAKRRSHTVVDGESLASIAYAAYRNPNMWRALARANRIDDPMRVRAGTVLDVPDRHEAMTMA